MVKGRYKIYTEEQAKLRQWTSNQLHYINNKEAVLEYQKKRYKENIVERKEKQKVFYDANRDKLLEYQVDYYNNNIEKKRAYYQANKEKIKAKRDAKKNAIKEKNNILVILNKYAKTS